MKTRFAALMLIVTAASVAHAQDVQFQFTGFRDVESAVASQQRDISQIQARLASLEDESQALPVAGGTGCCDTCYCDGSWYAGAAAVIAKPFFEDEVDFNDGSDEAGYDYELTPRIWTGYRNCDGLGVRASYWIFDHSSGEGPDDIDSPFHLTVESFDLDVTQTVCWSSVDADLFGGIRYGHTDHRDVDDEGERFQGVGPTVGVNVLAPYGGNLALVGGFRLSALFGETDYTDGFGPGADDFIWTMDTSLGIEYCYCTCNGTLAIRGAVEAQVWGIATDDASEFLDESASTDEDLAFLGYVFGIEYRR